MFAWEEKFRGERRRRRRKRSKRRKRRKGVEKEAEEQERDKEGEVIQGQGRNERRMVGLLVSPKSWKMFVGEFHDEGLKVTKNYD